MKRRGRAILAAGLSVILVLTLTVGAFAASGVSRRSLSAVFRNIQLQINGKIVATEEEPFIVDGRTYVPLRVVSQALGAKVDWNPGANLVTIDGSNTSSEVEALKAQLQQKEAENTQLKLQLEALQGSSGTDVDVAVKGLLDLTERIKSGYGKLNDVKIRDIRFTGNENDINVNIDVDLDDYDDEWEALTDSKIKSWVSDLCLDIQDYYSENTSIMGRIKDIDSKDILIEFSKYRTQALKISYKDKDYRHGRGLDIYDVQDDWKGQKRTIAGLRFNVSSIIYDIKKDEINLALQATDARERDWEDADPSVVKAAVKDLCKNIANDFIEDAMENPRTINVRLYDKINSPLDSFQYDVNADSLK